MRAVDILSEHAASADAAVIVAPYIKEDALKPLLEKLPPAATLLCVSRWTVEDVRRGVSDITCFRQVIDHGGTFRLHQRLHAKYFRFSDAVFIGSANVTQNGLGISLSPNIEILHSPSQSFDAQRFEDEIIAESIAINENEAKLWQKIQQTNQLDNELLQEAMAMDTWLPTTREPYHVWLAYSRRSGEIISADERRLAERELERLRFPENLEEADFNSWLAARLLSSARVYDVRLSLQLEDAVGWDLLVARWGVSRSVAARTQTTVANWLREMVG